MKIKLLTSISGSEYCASPGQEITVEAAEAARLIAAGFAEPAVEAPETATMPKARKR